jgi:NADH-quinone oxidoreductase subunit K
MKFYFIVSALLFSIGFSGLCLHRRSLISMLMSLELLFLSAGLNFIGGSAFWNKIEGHMAVLITLLVSAVEVAIGLALFIVYFQQGKNLYSEDMVNLKED